MFRRSGLEVGIRSRKNAKHYAASDSLIAMGTRGLTGLRHLLLGSTAERVVEYAPCPVMTIRR